MPKNLVRWADVGGDIVEPVDAKKDVGFANSEKPAPQFVNWLMNMLQRFMEAFTERFWAPTDGYLVNLNAPSSPWKLGIAAWVATTAYVVGDRVANGTTPKRIYQCRTAGTSAGSGGPTSASLDIADNTAHWIYVCDDTSAGAAGTADTDAILGQNNSVITIPIEVGVGERLLSITLYLFEGSAASHVAMYLSELDMSTGQETPLTFTGAVDHMTATGVIGSKTLVGTIDGGGYEAGAGRLIRARVQFGANGGLQLLRGAQISTDIAP